MAERPKPQVISLDLDPGIETRSLIDSAAERLRQDGPLMRRLGEESYSKLIDYVIRLLRGEVFLAKDIKADGLDPNTVRRKATSLYINRRFTHFEAKSVETRVSQARRGLSEDRFLQNPHRFLGDRSGRND